MKKTHKTIQETIIMKRYKKKKKRELNIKIAEFEEKKLNLERMKRRGWI